MHWRRGRHNHAGDINKVKLIPNEAKYFFKFCRTHCAFHSCDLALTLLEVGEEEAGHLSYYLLWILVLEWHFLIENLVAFLNGNDIKLISGHETFAP